MIALALGALLAQVPPPARIQPARVAVRAWFEARLQEQPAWRLDVLQRRALAAVRPEVLADFPALCSVLDGCFSYPPWRHAGRWAPLADEVAGAAVLVPADYDPARRYPAVVVVVGGAARTDPAGRIAALYGAPPPGHIVVVAAADQLGKFLRSRPAPVTAVARRVRWSLFGLGLGCAWLPPDHGRRWLLAAAAFRTTADRRPAEVSLFPMLGVLQRRLHLDRDRLVLDCAPDAVEVGLRAVQLAPDRFAGLIVRGPNGATADGALANLATVPVAVVGSAAALARQLRTAGVEVQQRQESGLLQWLRLRRRRLFRPAVKLQAVAGAAADGYWVRVDAGDLGAADGASSIDVRADRSTNVITVSCVGVERFSLLLNDVLVDLDRELTVVVNDVPVVVRRRRSALYALETVYERFDPGFVFTTMLSLDVPRRG